MRYARKKWRKFICEKSWLNIWKCGEFFYIKQYYDPLSPPRPWLPRVVYQDKKSSKKICIFGKLFVPLQTETKLYSMKLSEYFDNLPIGEVVNKRGLAYFKRMGYIWDYSEFGYLESVTIYGKKENDGYRAEDFRHLFPFGNAKVVEGYDNAMYEKYRQTGAWNEKLSREDMRSLFGGEWEFEFKGNKFGMKFYDGCFSPYLVKTGSVKPVSEVKHKMAFQFGVV